ncbi:aminotransferase class V-fold PLP-dependent enzyme [Mesoaciditoga lauensis]|uniref:aminotransferase class V-fold PLP-dependent enzyme n=1 Tax=Mesoaciditoga lauensis TaxID=1495039 RepID=UPI0005633B94|nr:SufS family cysteine desulfurase [Mesoaciditoga lauensis]
MESSVGSRIKADFPILSTIFEDGQKLVYLDNAATTQKPKCVIERINHFYTFENANVSRGAHRLGNISTVEYKNARKKVAKFINAQPSEITFTSGTTESINAVVYIWGEENIHENDEILVLESEHHSNFVPWQQLAKRKKAVFKVLKVEDDGTIDLKKFKMAVTQRTRVVAFAHATNTFGVIHPIHEMIEIAHSRRAITVVDGAQSVPHIPTDIKEMGADFLAFSGHKMLGPMGIGVLYVSKNRMNELRPFLMGGGMIDEVKNDFTKFALPPEKFEAGTPNVAGAVGLATAIEYLEKIQMKNVLSHDHELLEYVYKRLTEVKDLKLYGPRKLKDRVGVLSFNIKDIHPHDVATILDAQGVAIRAGHHCAQPLLAQLKIYYTARASFYIYNTKEDIDSLVNAVEEVKRRFA